MTDSIEVQLSEITAHAPALGKAPAEVYIPHATLKLHYMEDVEVTVPGFEEGQAWYSVPQSPLVTIGEIASGTTVFRKRETPYMTKWHQSMEGMHDLYHTYCPAHPDYGTCTSLADAYRSIGDHLEAEHDG